MIFTDAIKIGADGEQYPGTLLETYTGLRAMLNNEVQKHGFVIGSAEAFSGLFDENYIPTSSVMVKRNVLASSGPFDESLINGDDRDMWYRITRKHAVGYIDLPLHKYRIRQGSVSKRGAETARNRIRVLEKQLTADLPSMLKKKTLKLIASNYYGIGYAFRRKGKMQQARKNYIESLRHQFNIHTLRSYLATFLGERLLEKIRPR